MHGGLDALHREVRALDDAQLDRRATPRATRERPLREGALNAVRVGEISLKHDSGAEGQELRLVEDLAEGRHRQVEIAVLLHVEVDELGRDPSVRMAVAMPSHGAIERAQTLGHLRHRRAEGDEVDLAVDGRDLHRDVLHVVSSEEREIGLESSRRFLLAQDRLAELVEVQPHARAAPFLDVAAEVFFLARQDHVLSLVAQPGHDGRDDQARQIVGHGAAQEERDPLPPVHVLGHAVALEKIGELVGDALRAMTAERLVGEGDGQLLAVGIRHHPGELLGLSVLVGGLLTAGLVVVGFVAAASGLWAQNPGIKRTVVFTGDVSVPGRRRWTIWPRWGATASRTPAASGVFIRVSCAASRSTGRAQ